MHYCPKCKIVIRGNKTCCPLCEGKILGRSDVLRTGIDERMYDIDDFSEEPDEPYPTLPERKINGVTFVKICTFLLAIIIVLGITLKYLFGDMVTWVGMVILGSVVLWLDILAIMRYRYNILKVLAVEVLVAIIVDYYIDKVTGFHGWSVIWMIPFCLVGHSIASWIIAKFMKLRIEEYIIYIVFDAVLAFSQAYFIWSGENTYPYAAVFVMAAFAIAVAALLLFRFRELSSATQRMFNV
ncbi:MULTISPECIES: DUF6320 domain-containing protein [unclassified Butyrivibrio]|uniref:DUF6320 domain-containing protein n=1 Tax=unclassified Butyrivibrio TaxID=2639466 RepID=UPI0003B31904|nr:MULTISPECIES: DUF6320 domain-containing protein [unclassified Butyrivibrio]SEL49806.1 hypothetical protein SAMN04487770_11153 [Butyrivibrio sp. ob235]